MRNDSDDVATVAATPKRTSRATKLLQAAALAAMLVPLGTIAVETAPINCTSTSGGGSGACESVGNYTGGAGLQSNTWNFYSSRFWDGSKYVYENLIYTFQIAGDPSSTFSLDVNDWVQGSFAFYSSTNFPGLLCVPTYDAGLCGVFSVYPNGAVNWNPGADGHNYSAAIKWNVNTDALSQPSNHVTILQMKDLSQVFTNTLWDIWYDPLLPPPDPGIGGRGDTFSTFGVFAEGTGTLKEARERRPGDIVPAVPEPASLILLGTGLAGAIHRARRRKRQR